MRPSLATISTLVLALVLVGCPQDQADGEACRITLQVRQPTPGPLQDATTLRTFVFDGGITVYADEASIPSTTPGTTVEMIGDNTEPVIPFSSSFEVVLASYRPGQTVLGGFGRSQTFACEGEAELTIPVYMGPSMGFAVTEEQPEARQRGTATALTDQRVFIYGGMTLGGSPVIPVADLYDHASGLSCATAGGCPSGASSPTVGHSATLMVDGRVLIVGGQTPVTSTPLVLLAVRNVIERFDPASGNVEQLATDLPRSFHAAVLLDGPEVPAAKRGHVLIVGGRTDQTNPNDVTRDIILLDPGDGSWSVVGSLASARYAHTATLLGSRVLVTGGFDASGTLYNSAELFDVDTEQPVTPAVDAPCPSPGGAATAALCARRANHIATTIGNGNVMLWGGATMPVTGGEDPEPEAEVFVASERRFVPLRLPVVATGPRIGHSVTAVACFRPPCPLLITGGEDPNAAAVAHPPYLVTPPDGVEVDNGAYTATVTPFSSAIPSTLRAYHSSAALPDGGVLLTGGIRADVDQLMFESAVFSYCEDVASVGGIGCPIP